LTWFDRSTFCGRHMDTGDYNAYAQPMRTAINCLHEANVRTNLQDLILNYVPKDGFDFVNDYFEHTALCWNAIVHYVDRCMHIYDETNRCFREEPPAIPVSCPAVLREMMLRMRQVIEGIGWLSYGLPRENIIEPQLGYALRYLVTSLQKGQGCAHGLVGIFEVKKNG